MNGSESLRAIAVGRPLPNTMLGTCRLESGEVEAFGSEAIVHAFRRWPISNLDEAVTLDCPTAAVLLTGTQALLADLYDGRIGRLWRVGQAGGRTPEPAVGVAFDTDLHQTRVDVLFRAEDHPAFTPTDATRVRESGLALIDDPDYPAFRTKAFVVRAFGNARRGTALFALHVLASDPVRRPSFGHAVATWVDDDVRYLRDPVVAREFRTRIAT